MATFNAGFGLSDITPKLGCKLVGYGGRDTGAIAVHDRLSARALVMEDENGCWAIVSCDLCYLFAITVDEIRQAVRRRLGLAAERIFVATTHTHAGPHDRHADNWERPLAEIVADAVEAAYRSRRPARLGSGYGFLYGHSINRRWLDRPVDPGIAVLRVDDADGNILGLFTNFACHAVVMGSDNLQISGDWPGYAIAKLESTLGPNTTCLFTQGGAADVNPLVTGVRKRLRSDHTVVAIGNVSAYYGAADDPQRWNIGDRGGGTFAEAAELGEAFAEEVAYIARTITTAPTSRPLWSESVVVNAAADPGEHPQRPAPPLATEKPLIGDETNIPAEIMMLGVGDMALVGQPGEVFGETAVDLKIRLRAMGYRTPALVSYANGFLLYLPVPDAFGEGGYEPGWAVSLGISKQFQPRVWQAIEPVLQRRAQS
ncbi:MAG: neutral/alkaline non-lysosomal ceramidase N-terminal domain-containing protein [Chloroflexi bacterium]|nr:neutral/alkaline non-lysosomal ceramidase N-terminal domain-containing protein [Chloroflexota bacterium]